MLAGAEQRPGGPESLPSVCCLHKILIGFSFLGGRKASKIQSERVTALGNLCSFQLLSICGAVIM
jgi:hypothetical protein